ncbi:hypothetical protein N7462_004215 [Penicillium macrosclerotiorum]|uniref:uncharacterized protein n=1 Tax=Penicillium macrosclerotiorum TaxID=303699 RepID=UPI002546942B|nr:uncharacterized protein N7462_004215 [Penicillium macrosclerotiorum]KAJ5689823.1 hypothetical protein N7462_004215 [Penicillium macrosclerotiorum]
MFVMFSLLTTLGLRDAPGEQPPPNHAALLLLANWAIAYLWMSTRIPKILLGIDNNVAPREDLTKYGEEAVKLGKISRYTLNKLKREEAAHANAMEGYTLFVATSMYFLPAWAIRPESIQTYFQSVLIEIALIAVFAGVPNRDINMFGVWYTLSRIAFSLCYSYIETPALSYMRSLAWWSGNISCIHGLLMAAKRLQ